jgi:hypothetical protein
MLIAPKINSGNSLVEFPWITQAISISICFIADKHVLSNVLAILLELTSIITSRFFVLIDTWDLKFLQTITGREKNLLIKFFGLMFGIILKFDKIFFSDLIKL